MKPPKKQDETYLHKTFQYGDVTVRVFRPILTDEERKKREKEIMSAVGRILNKYDWDDRDEEKKPLIRTISTETFYDENLKGKSLE